MEVVPSELDIALKNRSECSLALFHRFTFLQSGLCKRVCVCEGEREREGDGERGRERDGNKTKVIPFIEISSHISK